MPSSGDFTQTVKQQADIVRVVGEYVRLKKSGAQNYSGLCPFHKEKTPSFSVHATRQFYHCFGCGLSGDVFSFVQRIENLSFPEAVRLVAQKVGVPLPKQGFSSAQEAREARLRGALMDLHERACVFFEEQLGSPEGARAREYLAGRGLSQETIRKFRVGYAPESGFLLRDRVKGFFDEELLRASGLFSWKQDAENTKSKAPSSLYSKFRNRVIFPISNESGKIIAFTGRTLAADERSGPKYLNSPETAIYSKGRVLFNLDRGKEAIRRLDYVILVEGQMDCISVDQAGFHNVIASSGTAFTEAQVRLLSRFTRKVVVNFDPDTAGAAAAERSLALLVAEEFEIKVLTLEPGLDPDLFVRRRGGQAYGQALLSAPGYFQYLIARAQSTFPTRTPEGKVKAANFLLPHIHRVPSRIARDELASEVAQKLGIDSAVLRQELRHTATARSGTVQAPAKSPVTPAERILIRALASAADLSETDPSRQVCYVLATEPLHEGLAGETLINALLQAEASDPLSLPLEESDRRLLAACLMHEDEELTPELVEGALDALRRRRLEGERRRLGSQIAEAERRQDATTLTRLMEEKQRIDRALALY